MRNVLNTSFTGTPYQNTRIWITEIGFPTAYVPGKTAKNSSNKTQRVRLLDSYLRFGRKTPRIKAFLAHRLVDNPIIEPHRFGVLNNDYTVKAVPSGALPVYCGLADRLDVSPLPASC